MSAIAIVQQPGARSLGVALVPIVIFLVAVLFLPVLVFFIWLFQKEDIGG
jgi:hypothetical protein